MRAFAKFAVGSPKDLLNVFDITIKPFIESYPPTAIGKLQLVQRGHAETQTSHYRLVWSLATTTRLATTPLTTHQPWSPLTGAFSYFDVYVNKLPDRKYLGRAYATEFIIGQLKYQRWKYEGKTKVFEVHGYAFDGTKIGYTSADLVLLA